MKLTFAIILIGCLHVSAGGFSQSRISVDFRSVQLKRALSIIEKKSSFRFLYKENLVTDAPPVTLSATDVEVTEVLNRILDKTGITYQLMANHLVVLKTGGMVDLQDIRVTGKVSTSTGEAVIGASVSVKGTGVGVATDAQGMYAITAPENAVLVFSSVGFVTQEIPVNGRETINVTLAVAESQLEQIVVIGYGTAKKRDLTGSIFTVKGDEIADKPAANALALLQGKVPGLSIVNSGRPGAEPDVRIRGTSSINGLKPVYIVDGILNDNINFLNPADIESVEVLKDPSSLAIFGVRGANGAIAITTKKAKAGQLLVNFNSSVGIKRVQERMKFTNAAEFKELYTEQLANQAAGTFDYSLWTADTDWQDEIFQNAVLNYNNISVTGATEKNRFYLGLGYINEEGIILHEKYKKYTLNFNDELRVSKAIKFGITFNAYYAELPDSKGVGSAIRAAPIAPVMDPGTGLFHTLPAFQRAQVFNPLVNIEVEKQTAISHEYRAVGSIYGEVDFLQHFNFRVQLYADYGFNTSRSYNPILVVYNPEIVGSDKRDTSRAATSVFQSQNIFPKVQSDYLLTFKKKFGLHDLTVLGGVTTYYRAFEGTNSSVQQGSGQVIPNNPDKWYVDQVGDPSTKVGGGSSWEDASLSFLARALYNYDGKYLVNASFRRDGSSQFYRFGNQWKNFGAVGLAWVVSRENFFAGQNVLDYLKVKGSWGILGNKNIDGRWRYPAYPTLTSANSGVFGDNIVAALQREFIPAENLNWETVHSFEVGLELITLQNRLNFEVNYYNRRTKDVLTIVEGPTGTIPGLDNLGEIKNSGFEFAATWSDDINRDWSYSVSGNLTTISNEVIQLNKTGYSIFSGPARTTAGFPIAYFYGYVHDGIYQSNADILKSPASNIGTVMPGDIRYKDVNGDGVITTDDRTIIGNPTPDFTYGGSISVRYKSFDFGVDLQGVYGNEIFRAWNQGTFADFNYLEERLERWNGPGSSNWEPILSTKRANNYQNSSYWIEDGSFFRIRNVQLGYTFNAGVLERIRLKSLRIFLNAQNLATFSNSTGYTPEIGGSATSFGIDNGTYPVPAVYTAGINLNF